MNKRRQIVSWTASAFLHAIALGMGAILLVRSAYVRVDSGETSTPIEMTLQVPPTPAPLRAVTPPLPPQPAPPQPASVPEVPKPTPAKIVTGVPIEQPQKTSSPVKVHAALPAIKSALVSHQKEHRAAPGAVQAEPDVHHNDPPEYPEESRTASEQGVVILRVEVMASGEPARVNILHTSGYFRLDEAARRAVLRWRFEPGTTAGIPTSSETDVPVRFRLQ